MLQPWFAKKGTSEVKTKFKLRFDFYIEALPEGIVELVLEKPEKYIISVNGQILRNTSENEWWIDKCFERMPIAHEMLKQGLNSVHLSMDFSEDINLEALYLIGDFGVKLEECKKTLVKLPDTIMAGDLTPQGLPFYTGKVRYVIPVGQLNTVNNRVFLDLNAFEGACVTIVSKHQEDAIIAWYPYEADITDYITEKNEILLDVVLTRRNTFGPLHQIPLKAPAYGPFSFVTEGEAFSPSYVLYPSGLLAEPNIKIKQSVKSFETQLCIKGENN